MNRRNFLTSIAAALAILAIPTMAEAKKRKYRPATEDEIIEAGYAKVQYPYNQDGTGGEYVYIYRSIENNMNIEAVDVEQFQNRTDKQIDRHFSDWPNTILRPFVKLTDKNADKRTKRGKK